MEKKEIKDFDWFIFLCIMCLSADAKSLCFSTWECTIQTQNKRKTNVKTLSLIQIGEEK